MKYNNPIDNSDNGSILFPKQRINSDNSDVDGAQGQLYDAVA